MIRSFHIAVGICAIGFLWTFLAVFPGWLCHDTYHQLLDGLKGEWNDWLPFPISFLLVYSYKIIKTPLILLLLQNFFYWGSFINLSGFFYEKKQHILTVLVALMSLYPPFLTYQGVIFNDTLPTNILFWVVTNQIYSQNKDIKNKTLLLGLLVFVGITKPSYLFSIYPIILWILWGSKDQYFSFKLISKKFLWSISKPILIFTALVIVIGQGITFVFNVKPAFHSQYIMMHDLSGILHYTDDCIFPEWNRSPVFTCEKLKQSYTTIGLDHIIWQKPEDNLIVLNQDPLLHMKLSQIWMSSIIKHPIAYLKHRTLIFLHLFQFPLKDYQVQYHFQGEDHDPKPTLGYEKRYSVWSDTLHTYIEESGAFGIFKGYRYLFLVFISFIVASYFLIKRKSQDYQVQTIFYVSLAGLLFYLPYFLIAPASYALRYLYWGNITALICLFLLISLAYPKKNID